MVGEVWFGVFSESDLYPGFVSETVIFFPTTCRLPQNEYLPGVGVRARFGTGVAL